MARFVYVGSETRTESGHRKEGITVFKVDPLSGNLERIQEAESGETPSFLAVHPDRKHLYAINEVREGRATAFSIDSQSGKLKMLNTASVKGLGPCYISIEPGGGWACVANYGGGSVSVLPVKADGSIGDAVATDQHVGKGQDPKRQEGPHAHSIISDPKGKFILSADLGTDRIYVYQIGKDGQLIPNNPPAWEAVPGAGPRHMAFHPNGMIMYTAHELNNTVVVCRWDPQKGMLSSLQSLPTLPDDFSSYNLVADIHLTPDGNYLYVTNRGHNSLVVYRVSAEGSHLEQVSWVSTAGNWPRNFTIDPEGKFMLVANQESDNLVQFKIDPATGLLERTGKDVVVPKPMFVTILDL